MVGTILSALAHVEATHIPIQAWKNMHATFPHVENKNQNFMCWELDILRFLTGMVGVSVDDFFAVILSGG
ncbi:hypothetical protein N7537_011833 [Penicillium hordei]|uniref:Uncharacterized protein n=1 Tax=Penicillium hordei TaxID=40994 RepID=A0AAD6GUG0_9EURO|nr:uncharacterized protein N7537_011833 [Penicillium hordei]KAJ5589155.1 hypothetical protein N7537_011833 [Penicillium hordei]